MSESEVSLILQRLAVIETKIDDHRDLKAKVERLQLLAATALGMAVASGLPQLAGLLA